MPQFHNMVRESRSMLERFGSAAKQQGVRLSFHPSQFIVLNSPNPEIVKKSIWDLESQAEMLDLMGLGPEAVMVIHVGGAYGDRNEGRKRWVETWKLLPEHVRRRLVLENDDIRYSAADVLWVHEQTGVRLIFDFQHFWCFNPEGLEMRDTVERMLATWPSGVRPKIHFSSPRTQMRGVERKNKKTDKKATAYVAPIWTGHADFANPFEFITFMRTVPHLDFDVMLESKSKDLSVIRLRSDLLRYAPDVAARFGLFPEDAKRVEEDERETMEMEKYSAT